MPAIRVTVALNTKQSSKTPVLLPGTASFAPEAKDSYRELISKAAQTKLRLKKTKRVFVSRTGQELLTEQDWRDVLTNDVVLLVSAGEEYVGLKKEERTEAQGLPNPDCEVVVLAQSAVLDSTAINQLRLTARTLPGLVHAVGQPDLHPGNRWPVGSVFVSEKWIHPPLIGGDIGCGMAWFKTKLSRNSVDGDKGKRIVSKLRGLEGAWRSQKERESWLTIAETCYAAGEEWDKSLGTIGAGNHFAEIQVVEASSATADGDNLGLLEDDVVLLVHSGSRGYGGNILKRFASDTNPSFHEDDEKAKAYLAEHERACQWAIGNRDLIALRFLACLEPGEEAWEAGRNSGGSDEQISAEALELARSQIRSRKVVDIWHNNVERVAWPPLPPTDKITSSNGSDRDLAGDANALSLTSQDPPAQSHVWIHRKGAAPTYNPFTGQPLSVLPLPGSRSTPTLLLRPTFPASTQYGLTNALSLAHGAGRSMSRATARSTFSSKFKTTDALLLPKAISQLKKQTDGVSAMDRDWKGGSYVICDEKDLVWEEAPDAYKDVFAVADDLIASGAAEVVGWCTPRVSYKVRFDGRS